MVDVYAFGKFHGVSFKWIVQCKDWKSNVPKEVVLAFSAVVQDVGADRGFVLSEIGFQSGALRVAQKTNVTLTSLADLSSSTEEATTEAAIGALHWRLMKARLRLRGIKSAKYGDEWNPPVMAPLGQLSILEFALQDATRGEWPNVYRVDADGRTAANTLDELLKGAEEIIVAAEEWIPR